MATTGTQPTQSTPIQFEAGSSNPATSNAGPSHPRQNFDPAPLPANAASAETTEAGIQEAFVADRQMFWSRFTNFTTGSVIAIVVLLIAMAVFLR